jgi:nucleoside-triphosphatase
VGVADTRTVPACVSNGCGNRTAFGRMAESDKVMDLTATAVSHPNTFNQPKDSKARSLMLDLKNNILITGHPAIGKTTLIKKLFYNLNHLNPVGFYTQEIREKGVRKGFKLISFYGEKRILSHVTIKSGFRVGKYGVDVEGFENFLDSISFFNSESCIVIIDEIGKMECFSDKFKLLLTKTLNSQKQLIATVALKGAGIIADIKKRNDIVLFEMTLNNRDSLLSEVLKLEANYEQQSKST